MGESKYDTLTCFINFMYIHSTTLLFMDGIINSKSVNSKVRSNRTLHTLLKM